MDDLYKMKIVLLGESGVGKTCIIERYVSNTYQETESTEHAVFRFRNIVSPNGKAIIKQTIWDTAGQEIYRSLSPFYYRDADAVVFIYDTTNKNSFNELSYWVNEVKQNGKSETLLAIAGNKSDLVEKEEIKTDDAKSYADKENASFFLISAKENLNISEMFLKLGLKKFPRLNKEFGYDEDMKELEQNGSSDLKKNNIKLSANSATERKKCC